MKRKNILAISIIVAIAIIVAVNDEAVNTSPELIAGDTSGGFDVNVGNTPTVNLNNLVTNVGISVGQDDKVIP